MRYVVGYTPDSRGADALALATTLAQSPGAQLEVIHVLDGPAPSDARSDPERMVQEARAGNAEEWLTDALGMIPAGVEVTTAVRYAPSVVEGLIEAGSECAANLIVVGAARAGLLRRFTLGSSADSLLHASPIPLALVPAGYKARSSICRITCAIGTRPGAEALFDVALDAAAQRQIPLRLISLLALGSHEREPKALEQAEEHAQAVLDKAAKTSTQNIEITAKIGTGKSIEEAIEELRWDNGEIVVIGSSRLAVSRRIFLGTTANKMLRSLPVPMVVVPRDYQAPAVAPAPPSPET